MCNVKNKSSFKTITVYKVVQVMKGDPDTYYSAFAGKEVELGIVKRLKRNDVEIASLNILGISPERFLPANAIDNWVFQPMMVGRSSGFALLNSAHILRGRLSYKESHRRCTKIIKIKLGGSILSGTGDGMGMNNDIVYAGTKILSIEEV